MKSIRILIADDNDAFRSNLLESLSAQFTVQACRNGKEALEEISSFRPDILVMDLLLRELDGLTLLYQVSQLPQPPAVLVTTTFISHYVKDRLQELGVSGLMLKPCDLKAIIQHILRLTQNYIPPVSPRAELIVSRLLCGLNIPTHMDGNLQLKTAIPIFATDPTQPLNKVIYAQVAKKCGYDNAKQVERSIRNVIDKAWKLHTDEIWSEYFPAGKPSNKVFISRLAEELNNRIYPEAEPAAD